MARGRPPKSREQRIAEGNPSRRPLPEPVLGLGKVLVFDPPDDLRPAERAVWAAIVPEFAALGWVDRIDRLALTQLCIAAATADELRAEIKRNGVMLSTYDEDGNERGVMLNPAVNALGRQQQTVRQYLEQFGGTPSARARLGLTVAKGADIAARLAHLDDPADDDDVIVLDDDESPL
jgi:P27 family predicted phage terminase small subunit